MKVNGKDGIPYIMEKMSETTNKKINFRIPQDYVWTPDLVLVHQVGTTPSTPSTAYSNGSGSPHCIIVMIHKTGCLRLNFSCFNKSSPGYLGDFGILVDVLLSELLVLN
jgi:hypothetical protein